MGNARKTIMRFLFPFSKVPKGCRLVIYGAGEVGYDFYRQLKTSEYAEVALWVDRQYEWYRYLKLPVNPPEMIKELSYDRIVIAANTKNTYESVVSDLRRQGISENVIWGGKYCLDTSLAARYDKTKMEDEAKDAFIADPLDYLTADRLDIVIRILYARDILNKTELSYESGEDSINNVNLYKRLMMVQNDGREPTENLISGYFSEYELKSGWKAFDNSFRGLLYSMKEHGFLREYFVPVDNRDRLINGAHRLAAAVALENQIWVRNYQFDGIRVDFSVHWFKENGFYDREIEYIFDNYKKLKGIR